MAKETIVAVLGKPKGGGLLAPDGPEEEENTTSDVEVDDDEVFAAEQMRSAKSDSDYAKALKAFIKMCTGEYK